MKKNIFFLIFAVFLTACSSRNEQNERDGQTEQIEQTEISELITEQEIVSHEVVPNEPTREFPVMPRAENAQGEPFEISRNGLVALFDPVSGFITRISNEEQTLNFNGVFIDVGYNGAFLFSQVGFSDLDRLSTWELPRITPRRQELPDYTITQIQETEDGLIVEKYYEGVFIIYYYTFDFDGLGLRTEIRAIDEGEINGVAFITRGMELETARFEFPGSTPVGSYSVTGRLYRPLVSDYAAPPTVLYTENESVNIIFINHEEKWATGVFEDDYGASVINLSATLALIGGKQNEDPKVLDSIFVGDLFIQLVGNRDKYLSVQEYYRRLGFFTPTDGARDGPIISAHPSGVMDTGFTHRRTLQQFAERLPVYAEMGIKNVWLLPIFLHPGGLVYDTIEHEIIDPRYGGEEGAAFFSQIANDLGMRVLFDYVPKGPRPHEPLAVNNPGWLSRRRDGTSQIEWECVSFDYNNPEFAAYFMSVVEEHARTLGISGARIDCSMGGLPNWSAVSPFRASSSGLRAGVNISRTVRQGLINAGVVPMNIPENFHPIPTYAPYTDIFYDMPLYRAMHNLNYSLNSSQISETQYVQALQHWLWTVRQTNVEGQIRMRFLGNHDTSSWTFDGARPQAVYGIKQAQALWALMAFIDGVPMIYQGDEEPMRYGIFSGGVNLINFFGELFRARAEFIPEFANIRYIDLNMPVFAFERYNENTSVTVLINFSTRAQNVEFEINKTPLYSHNATKSGGTVELEAFGFVLLD